MTVAVSGDSITFPDNSVQNTAATGFGFKNRIINGAMVIDQRNAGASVTPTDSAYTVDRWQYSVSQASKLTAQQSSTAATGFIKSLLTTSSSAYSIVAADYFMINQRVEGLNVFDLGWGAAGASAVTLSFLVRSSLTGTFGGAINNAANDRSYPFTYTISVANTYEYKTITIAGDTGGTWLTTNGVGMTIRFGLGVGSTYSGTAGAWAAAGYFSATGATSVVGTSGATFYITGIDLRKGSTGAYSNGQNDFDYRPYGTELGLCQRYYYYFGSDQINNLPGVGTVYLSTAFNNVTVPFPVTMRTSPTFTYSSLSDWLVQGASGSGVALTALSQVTSDSSTKNGVIRGTVASGLTAGNAAALYANSSTARFNFSSEL